MLDARRTEQQNETKSKYITSNQIKQIQINTNNFTLSDQNKSNQGILSSIQSKSNQRKQNKIKLGDTPSNRDYLFFVGPYV